MAVITSNDAIAYKSINVVKQYLCHDIYFGPRFHIHIDTVYALSAGKETTFVLLSLASWQMFVTHVNNNKNQLFREVP